MDLVELGAAIDAATRVRRLETLGAYQSASDVDWVQRYLDGGEPPEIEAKRAWLDRLATAADRGHPRERLRLVHTPVPAYVRYSAEWGYVDNVAAGEVVRVLDAAAEPLLAREAEELGDLYILDRHVVDMRYDDNGRFQQAVHWGDPDAEHWIVESFERLWSAADDFTSWWTMRPDLHRDVHA